VLLKNNYAWLHLLLESSSLINQSPIELNYKIGSNENKNGKRGRGGFVKKMRIEGNHKELGKEMFERFEGFEGLEVAIK
jgi:hypothetical protein